MSEMSELEVLKNQIENLTLELKEEGNTIEKFKEVISDQSDQIEKLEKAVKEAEALKKGYNELEIRKKSLITKLQSTKDDLKHTEDKLKHTEDKLKHTEDKLKHTEDKLKLTEDKMGRCQLTSQEFKNYTDLQNSNCEKLIALCEEVFGGMHHADPESQWVKDREDEYEILLKEIRETAAKFEKVKIYHIDKHQKQEKKISLFHKKKITNRQLFSDKKTTNLDKSSNLDAFKTEVAMLSSIIARRSGV